MSIKTSTSRPDPFILQCCLLNKQQPYIGINQLCPKNTKFCLQHSRHTNSQGLIHQMMPIRQFKRKIDQRKYNMQQKVNKLIDTFTNFIDRLIQQIRQIKLKKCLQLSMLWLRDVAASQDQYQLMKKIYRMEFQGVSCRDVHSVYYKIIHNQGLYSKQLDQLNCYQGICKALKALENNYDLTKLLAEKLTQIQGVITNGELLKKVLPDRKIVNQHLKQVLLDQTYNPKNYQIIYNKSRLLSSFQTFKPFFSKYPIIPHITYHISIKTKYSNIMLGICGEKLKQIKNNAQSIDNLQYSQHSIVYNCANGNTYKQGMFVSGSNAAIKGLNQLEIKLRVTDKQVFLMTNKYVLMRSSIQAISGNMYLIFMGRTEGDSFQINCDNDISADNVRVLSLIKQQQQNSKKDKKSFRNQQNASYSNNQIQNNFIVENDYVDDISNVNINGNANKNKNEDNKVSSPSSGSNVYVQQSQQSQVIQNKRLVSLEDDQQQYNSPILIGSRKQFMNKNMQNQNRKPIAARAEVIGQIIQQDSNLESTIGAYRPKQNYYNQHLHNPNKQDIGYNFKKSRPSIQLNTQKAKIQEISQQNWISQKDKYLKDIRQKIDKMKAKNKVPETKANKGSLAGIPESQSSRTDKQKKQAIMMTSDNKIYLQSQSGGQQKKVSKQFSNSQHSKININISDQGFSNPNGSVIRMSLLSGLRKGSETVNQQQIKLKGLLQMAQSLQPRSTYKKQQVQTKINKIKTPPKISEMQKRFAVNQSFQF